MRLNRFGQVARDTTGAARGAVWLTDEIELCQRDVTATVLPRWLFLRSLHESSLTTEQREELTTEQREELTHLNAWASISPSNEFWEMVTRTSGGPWVPVPGIVGGCNDLAASNGAWMRYLAGTPLSGSRAWAPADGFVGDMDGDLAVTVSQDGLLLFVWRAGVQVAVRHRITPFGGVRLKGRVLSWVSFPGPTVQAIDAVDGQSIELYRWDDAQYTPIVFTSAADNRDWVLYQTDRLGLVLHRVSDKSQGYQFGTPQSIYSPDVAIHDAGRVTVGWASDAGEMTCHVVPVTLGQGMIPLPAPPIVVPPDPREPGPVGDGAPAGTWVTLAPYIDGDPALGPRSNTHPIQHVREDRADGRHIHLVKFGDVFDDRYETWAIDHGGNIHHVMDASNEELSCLTDTRWFPASMRIGPAYALVTGEHRSLFFSRTTGEIRQDDPINRRMWVLGQWDRFYWPGWGELLTVAIVYDNTAGFHAPDRYIEIYCFALGPGWMRWEAHRSDVVYATGVPVFSEASRHARSDFYTRTGGAPIVPRLASFTQPLTPFAPDPETPTMIRTDFLNMPGATFDLRWASYSYAERARRIAAHVAVGYTHVCLMAIEDDAASRFDLYADQDLARALVAEIRASGLKAMMWLLCETPGVVGQYSPGEWAERMRTFVSAVDADAYCLGLELDEHFDEAAIGLMADRVRSVTPRPIYIHGSQGQFWRRDLYRQHPAITGLLFQYHHTDLPGGGFLSNPGEVAEDTREGIAHLATVGHPVQFIGWEYALTPNGGYDSAIAACANAAQEHGSAGFGNGGGAEVVVPIPPDAIDPATVTWLRTNTSIGTWARTAAITAVTFRGDELCVKYSKVGQWPTYLLNGDTPVEANPIIIVRRDGQLYGATWDWFRPGQQCKTITPIEFGRDQIQRAPLDASWPGPQPGEEVWMLVSAVSRDGLELARERSNIVRVQWGVYWVPTTPPGPEPPTPGHPILDADLTDEPTAYRIWVHESVALRAEATAWYQRAYGRAPAVSDVQHGLWRGVVERLRWGTYRAAWRDTWPGGDPR